eukprot:INCI3181.2.p1 GENE.INCI3181.2~~INCI3181.2.p1  ORF type:complete len:538 (+),score=45.32 INCI3181.2:180-1793(+)
MSWRRELSLAMLVCLSLCFLSVQEESRSTASDKAVALRKAYDRWTELTEYPVEFLPSMNKFRARVNMTSTYRQYQKWCAIGRKPVRGIIRVDGLGHSLMGMISCLLLSHGFPNSNLEGRSKSQLAEKVNVTCPAMVMPFHSMFRTHFVFVEESRFLHRPKGDPTTNFEYCHLSTRVSERTVPMYAEPQTLVNMSGWHTSLTCSVLEEDPWRKACDSSKFCSTHELESDRPVSSFNYVRCDNALLDLAKHGRTFPVSALREVTAPIRQAIVDEHAERFINLSTTSKTAAFDGHSVDECGFGQATLNVVLHIRKGDVRANERHGAPKMSNFLEVAAHLALLGRKSGIPVRFVVFSEAHIGGRFSSQPLTVSAMKQSLEDFSVHLPEFPGTVFSRTPLLLPCGRVAYLAETRTQTQTQTTTNSGLSRSNQMPTKYLFRLDDRPWDAIQCMARSDVLVGSASSFSLVAALLSNGIRVLPTKAPFLVSECVRFGAFCKKEITSAADLLQWKPADLRALFRSQRHEGEPVAQNLTQQSNAPRD